MQGFKGLIPKQLITDEAFQPIFKKAEDQRKATQLCIDFFQLISKFFDAYSASMAKNVAELESSDSGTSFYQLSYFLIKNVSKETANLASNSKGSFKELTALCNTIFLDFSKIIMSFQTSIRKYQEYEQILSELSKKYFRSHKNMLLSIEAYKSSFSDVTLIYNMDEKTKRYYACEKAYKGIEEEYDFINQRTEALTLKKGEIIHFYSQLPDEFIKVTKVIGSKIIGETKNFVGYFCNSYRIMITSMADEKFAFEKEKIGTLFDTINDSSNLECFSQADLQPARYIPLFLEYHSLIKDEFLENYNAQLLNYLKEVELQIENRKNMTRKLYALYSQHLKLIEKNYLVGVKEILLFFEKMKRKLGESFGNRLVSFLKSVNSFFELSAGINEKLIKNTVTRLQSAQTYTNEENKLLKLFGDELKNNIEKFIGKKELKKLKENEFTEEENGVNVRLYRKEVAQKAEFIKHLISGFHEKMAKNSQKLKKSYEEIVSEVYSTLNEYFSFCLEYQELYFGVDEFQQNFEKYQQDIDKVLEKDQAYFSEIPLSGLKNETLKICFDGEFSKVEDFKKIKKPFKQQSEISNEDRKDEKMSETSLVKRDTLGSAVRISNDESTGAPPRNTNPKETMLTDEKELKNLEFLLEKVSFKENEKLIKSYSCALVEKIVLQGRIYITNERICFHSGFNSSNLFFGGTFIHFPKEDIKKVEKKMNAIFIDNSISFTTINGEVTFTSFFSRNEAYDLICQTFRFNFEDEIYEFEEKAPEIPEFLIELEEDDDMNNSLVQERSNKIDAILPVFSYAEAVKTEIDKEGFSAIKLFKIFYGESEIVINKRTHPNFLSYMKGLLNHKDLEIDPWEPPLKDIVNQSNIKFNAPLESKRKIRVTVPVSASGVPFMPKTAKSEESQTLYFYSKHKWVILGQISTSGAPYTDTFNVQVRTMAESDDSGKCRLSVGYFVNFLKSTMMKGMIEGKTQEETVAASRKWIDEIQAYFVELQKKKHKSSTAQSAEVLKEELEAKTKQLEDALTEKQKLVEEIGKLRAEKQMREYALAGGAVLLLILLVVLIS